MKLKPEVLKAIESGRKRIAWNKGLMVALLAPLLLGSLVLLVMTVVKAPDGSAGQSWPFLLTIVMIVLAAVFFLADLAIVVQSRRRRNSLRDLFEREQLSPLQKVELVKFRNGVQGASLAAGIEPPKGMVLDVPDTATVVFEDTDGCTAIAVTPALLEAGLSTSEADALMAQSVSRVSSSEDSPPRYTVWDRSRCSSWSLLKRRSSG